MKGMEGKICFLLLLRFIGGFFQKYDSLELGTGIPTPILFSPFRDILRAAGFVPTLLGLVLIHEAEFALTFQGSLLIFTLHPDTFGKKGVKLYVKDFTCWYRCPL